MRGSGAASVRGALAWDGRWWGVLVLREGGSSLPGRPDARCPLDVQALA